MTIDLTRKHAVLFVVLFATQMLGLWRTFSRSPVLATLPHSTWWLFFSMVPGSAFLNTIVLVELFQGPFSKQVSIGQVTMKRVLWWWLLIICVSIAMWLLLRYWVFR
jgi:hypothetical protein